MFSEHTTLDPRQLLLRPGKRIGRGSFVVGVVMLLALTVALEAIMRVLDPATAGGFWMGLAIIILFPIMLYSVYGQRLHDLGRTVWPLTATIFLLLFATIVVMSINGGSDLVYEVAGFSEEQARDPDTVGPIVQGYQDRIQARSAFPLAVIGALLWGGLTLWLALSPGRATDNKYGPALA